MTVTGVALHFDHAFLSPFVAGSYAWRAVFDNMNDARRSALGTVTTSVTTVVRVRSR